MSRDRPFPVGTPTGRPTLAATGISGRVERDDMTNALSITAIMWFAGCAILSGQAVLLVLLWRALRTCAPPVTVNVVAGTAGGVVQAGSVGPG